MRLLWDVPSGKPTVCYWKWPFIVPLPKTNATCHSYVNVYQRVALCCWGCPGIGTWHRRVAALLRSLLAGGLSVLATWWAIGDPTGEATGWLMIVINETRNVTRYMEYLMDFNGIYGDIWRFNDGWWWLIVSNTDIWGFPDILGYPKIWMEF